MTLPGSGLPGSGLPGSGLPGGGLPGVGLPGVGLPGVGLHWIKEDDPRWDAAKQRLFGPAELAAAGLDPPGPGAAVADEWWQVTGDDGQVAGYGWLDCEWGDAQITFWVDPARRGEGIGDFILDHLEAEAAARGLNYIYNVVPATHPDPDWITGWLTRRGFVPGPGDLRRQVHSAHPAS